MTSSVIYYSTDARKNEIYLLNLHNKEALTFTIITHFSRVHGLIKHQTLLILEGENIKVEQCND